MPHAIRLAAVLTASLCPLVHAVCDAPVALDIRTSQNQVQLSWKPVWPQAAWTVEQLDGPWDAQGIPLATVTDPAWSATLPTGNPQRFYRVVPDPDAQPPLASSIEDFERLAPYHSWSGEDVEPDSWERDAGQAVEGVASLHLFGNTVKAQPLAGARLSFDETWRVSARVDGVADRQMVGVADSANVMWYVLWGSRGGYPDSPGQSGQVEVSCYQGWFPEGQWVEALLPVGQDWMGKFGYLPELCHVVYANESDADAGEVWFDDLRRVDPQVAAPRAEPQWESLGVIGDSLSLRLWNAAHLDGMVESWALGDGRTVVEAEPVVRLARARAHRVALTSSLADGRWDVASLEVPGQAGARSVRLVFGGDVMTARSYEEPGGIIETQGVHAIFDSIRVALDGADLSVVNLECPYTTAQTEHPTKSITFKSRPENLAGVAATGVDAVSLANNHVFDWMEAGLQETIDGLAGWNLPGTGAGMNSAAARRPALLSHGGLSVGVAAFCDRTGNYNNAQPFLEAGLSRPGFSMWSRGDMQAILPGLVEQTDLLVLQVHSGNEYSTEPSGSDALGPQASGEELGRVSPVRGAWLAAEEGLALDPDVRPLLNRELLPDQTERALRHEAVELGSRLVIAHHPHIVQGFEVYRDGLIAHSLGNLVMDLSYEETMPSVLLEVEDDGHALQGAWLTPVFIENNKPRICRGETAALLLEHYTRLSRPFDTWVLRQPGAEKAWIALDTAAVAFTTSSQGATLPLELRDGWYTSPPVALGGEGELSSILQEAGVAGAEVRLGRNETPWGNMEDEGATLWDLNSNDESFVADVLHGGARSLRLTAAGATTYTYYTVRAPLDLASSWTLCGWIRTQGATTASLQARHYDTRTSDLLDSELCPALAGTQDWTRVWQDLDPAEATSFYQLRLALQGPAGGASAWFDDVALVEWDGWQPLPAGSSVPLSIPNDLQWVQVRVPANQASLPLRWTRAVCSNPPIEP